MHQTVTADELHQLSKEQNPTTRRLIPMHKWSEFHPWPSVAGLKQLVFYRQQNGFDRVIRKVGRTVLIDEGQFFIWVDERSRKAA